MNNYSPLPRSNIDKKYTWHAESMYANSDAWQADAASVPAILEKLQALQGTLAPAAGGSPAKLHAAFELMESLQVKVLRLYVYAVMSQAVDTGDIVAQGLVGQVNAIYGQAVAAGSFLEPELLAIGKPTLEAWIKADPKLGHRLHAMEDLFRRQEHVRSQEVEEVLGLAIDVFQSADNTHDMLVNADLKFEKTPGGLEVAQSSIDKLMGDADRNVRKAAWESYCDEFLAHKNTLAAALTTAVKRDVFVARTRKFDSALDAALFQHAIPRKVFESTVETFKKHLPVWHRYWKVRKKALKVETLEHFDIWAPLGTTPPVVSYEQCVEWIAEALAPLGKDYTTTLKKGCLQDRWVDAMPTVGKSYGAFSFGMREVSPFIMMSFTGDLSSLSTLTHELGHSMHSWHTWKHQPVAYGDYSIFVAEVASNFHQAMTRAYLFETQKDREFQIALIEEAMENFHRYFFIMPTLARFELEFHTRMEAGKGVTADDLNKLMCELFAEGYGDTMKIDPEREGITWAQFSHLYMNYYVFQYATGISAAHALAAPILAGDQAAAKRYVEFLSMGSSRYPVDALKHAGVDMTGPHAMEKGFEVVSQLVDRLEGLIG